jgi:hypothetical protein
MYKIQIIMKNYPFLSNDDTPQTAEFHAYNLIHLMCINIIVVQLRKRPAAYVAAILM